MKILSSCRGCGENSTEDFLDLGLQPLSNANLTALDSFTTEYEERYPLQILVCDKCWLVQTRDYVGADKIFKSDYPYYSSTSKSWMNHCKIFSEEISKDLALNGDSFVVEIASNDGYLLRNFVNTGIPCLGIEPTEGTASAAEKFGIPVLRRFFDSALAGEILESRKPADLIIANNVLAHVPDINDFILGLSKLLAPDGVITIEFPHLMNLMNKLQFDTFYHEHFSYLSLIFLIPIFRKYDLRIFKVEELVTHGGSLRVFVSRVQSSHKETSSVSLLVKAEIESGLNQIEKFKTFGIQVASIKLELLEFLRSQKSLGKKLVGYGAAAKANTLFNYLGIDSNLISCVYDAAPSKQGKFMPGSHIEISPPARMHDDKPDFIWILPWNLVDELTKELNFVEIWNGKLFIADPNVRIL